MSSFKKLRDGILQHRSAKVHVVIAIIQFLIALGLMMPVLSLISNVTAWHNWFCIKRRIMSESIVYISFEAFRLWLVLDSIIQMNALTIYVTALMATFIFVSSIITLVDYVVSDSQDTSDLLDSVHTLESELTAFFEFDHMEKIIQIIFSCSLIILTIPALWAAFKISKDFNWGVYKKIGARRDVQKRYRISQFFSIILKLNLFFEFTFFQILTFAAGLWSSSVVKVLTYFIVLISLPIGREAMARESHFLMILFLCMQIEYFVALIYFLYKPALGYASSHVIKTIFQYQYVHALCLVCSIICVSMTIILGVWCQFNFNKGLKEHVKWSFFGLKKVFGPKVEQDEVKIEEKLISSRVDTRIDID